MTTAKALGTALVDALHDQHPCNLLDLAGIAPGPSETPDWAGLPSSNRLS